jgi:dipeptidyl-peptidase-4
MKRANIIALLFLISFCAASFAQEKQPLLTLEKIYSGNFINTKSMKGIRWMENSSGYTTLEKNADNNGNEIVFHSASSGEARVLVSARQLTPEGADKPLDLSDYSWSRDDNKMLLFTKTKKVWRYNTKGDYWVLDLKTNKLKQLGKSLPESSLMFAKFSPDARRAAYVSCQNIYVEELTSGKVTKITKDGGDNIINGTFDWVYEEELGCRDGFRWSPDGQSIAYWQLDTKGTGMFSIINNIDSVYPEVVPYPYPKAGTANSSAKIGVVSSSGGNTKWFDIPGDAHDNYLARMDFIPNSNEIMIQQLNRLQNSNTVRIGNIKNMTLKTLLTESDKAWVDVYDNTRWLGNGNYFTWMSERDGWRHLFLVSRDGKENTLITKGEFDVVSISCIDEKGGYVYYIASPDNFTQRYLYRSRLDGKGAAQRVSPAEQAGQHTYNISPDACYAVHIFENNVTPPVYEMVWLPEHRQDNKAAREKYLSLGVNNKEFFRVNTGDVVLDGWMIKPAGFDSLKKYPVIFEVYGEPAGSTVQDKWQGGDLWHHYLAEQGYLVMSIDNRGTSVPRGDQWRKCIYGQIGILASKDQADAAREICRIYRYADSSRIGIWGWSGGGSMTLNCMFRYPEIYKTGVAVAFISDLKLYDNIYQERYMGLPSTNPDGYRNGSPINYAGSLKGNLMLIHGTGDDNVHYQNCERMVNELVKQNKLFSMMAYPMRTHSISERENTTLHLYRTMADYWLKNLAPGGK